MSPAAAGRTSAYYPPRVFHTKLDELLTERHLDDAWLCRFLNVVPITAKRIRQGTDLRLSDALRLARHLKVPVETIWQLATGRAA
jgi:hypothetical protein